MNEKDKPKNTSVEKIHQPVEAVGWRNKTIVTIEKHSTSNRKLFRPVVGDNNAGFTVSSRSRALKHAFDFCNANKLRVISVSGVRADKFTLW